MDPDAKDPVALDTTSDIQIEPLSDLPDLPDLGLGRDINTSGLQVSGMGLRSTTREMTSRATAAALSSFDSDFGSSSSNSESDSDDEGNDNDESSPTQHSGAVGDAYTPHKPHRRPSTTEAKHRISLDDDELDLSFTVGASTLSDSDYSGSGVHEGSGGSSHGGRATAFDDVQRRQAAMEAGTESPFADPMEFSEGSSSEDSEGDVVEIKPRRSF